MEGLKYASMAPQNFFDDSFTDVSMPYSKKTKKNAMGKKASKKKKGKKKGKKPSSNEPQKDPEISHLEYVLNRLKSEVEAEKKQAELFKAEIIRQEKFAAIAKEKLQTSRQILRQTLKHRDKIISNHSILQQSHETVVESILQENQNLEAERILKSTIDIAHAPDENNNFEKDIMCQQRQLSEELLETMHMIRLQMDNENSINNIRQKYQQDLENSKEIFLEQLRIMKETETAQKIKEISTIEKKKIDKVNSLFDKHKTEYQHLVNYFSDIVHMNFDLIKSLSSEVMELKKQEYRHEKHMIEVSNANRKLSEPLSEYLKQFSQLEVQYTHHEKNKKALQRVRAELLELKSQKADIEWSVEHLLQSLEKAKKERNAIKKEIQKQAMQIQHSYQIKGILLSKMNTKLKEIVQ